MNGLFLCMNFRNRLFFYKSPDKYLDIEKDLFIALQIL